MRWFHDCLLLRLAIAVVGFIEVIQPVFLSVPLFRAAGRFNRLQSSANYLRSKTERPDRYSGVRCGDQSALENIPGTELKNISTGSSNTFF